MPKNFYSSYPKVSIITCVYNGEKYISKLLNSVLTMGYSNIEHIIVDDGSTDGTPEIVKKYSELYKQKSNCNLCIKYIYQENMGLGAATNTGLQEITGDYWTWINCDDWYEMNAFFEPIKILIKNPKIDYVQMNGYYSYLNKKKEAIIKSSYKMAFYNKYRLYVQYTTCTNFKWLLYICRTSSFRKINPKMYIYPSRFTQDDQLITQIFGVLNGSFCIDCKWYFLQRDDNYLKKIDVQLKNEMIQLRKESIDAMNISNKTRKHLLALIMDYHLVEMIKKDAQLSKRLDSLKDLLAIIKNRKRISIFSLFYMNHKIILYFAYSFVPYFIKRKKV